MDFAKYGAFILEETAALLAVDSPSGMTHKAAQHVKARFEALGYASEITHKNGVLVNLAAGTRRTDCCWRRIWIRWAAWLRRSKAAAA